MEPALFIFVPIATYHFAFFATYFFELFEPSVTSARPSPSSATSPPPPLLRSVSMVSDGTGPVLMSPITERRPDGKVKRV